MEYVEYRLHMQPNFQRVNFDGYHIQVADLREEICTRENINKRDYYLKLLDEKTEKGFFICFISIYSIPPYSTLFNSRVLRQRCCYKEIKGDSFTYKN